MKKTKVNNAQWAYPAIWRLCNVLRMLNGANQKLQYMRRHFDNVFVQGNSRVFRCLWCRRCRQLQMSTGDSPSTAPHHHGPLGWSARCEFWEGRDQRAVLKKISWALSSLLETLPKCEAGDKAMVNVRLGHREADFMSMAMKCTRCLFSSCSIKGVAVMIGASRSHVATEPSIPPTRSHRPPGTRSTPPTSGKFIWRFWVNLTSSDLQPTSALLLNNTQRSNSSAEYEWSGSSKRAVRTCCATYWWYWPIQTPQVLDILSRYLHVWTTAWAQNQWQL